MHHIAHSEEDQQYLKNMIGHPEERERRTERLFQTLDNSKTGILSSDTLLESFREQYNPLPLSEESIENLISTIAPENRGYLSYEDFKNYIYSIEQDIVASFKALDTKRDGKLDFEELRDGLERLGIEIDDERAELFFNILDTDEDGFISYEEWVQFLLFVPLNSDDKVVPLQAAYEFFVEELDLSSEGDFFLSSETLNGFGYFLAGGFAGVVSRTCTAPFDRLKVYLIASSGKVPPVATSSKPSISPNPKQDIKASTSKALKTALSLQKSSKQLVAEAAEATSAVAAQESQGQLMRALKHLWSQGGIRAFFVGNGLNVIKVFPESAMKFGTFETVKRFFAQLEGVEDTSEISRLATFISGGLGGVVAQFTVYPIDTLKL